MRHSSDSEPGITRQRKGTGWAYFGPDGKRVTKREEIDRLNAIGLPPAYSDAWLCTDPEGHLQATGIDARGRKQYRYHPDFTAKRANSKFDGLKEFGKGLPKLRRRVEKDLRRRETTRETVLAAVIRLLDTEFIRVGNEQYARDNKSFGATTLRSRHISRKGGRMLMRFAGKHGIVHEVSLTDSHLKRVVRKCQELPGQMLFQYVNGDGDPKPVTSSDVNDYIKESMGDEFTAKHFRTWAASVIAMNEMLKKAEDSGISVKTVIEPVAEALGNTEAIEPQVLCPSGLDRGSQGRSARSPRRHGPAPWPCATVVVRSRADPISLETPAAAQALIPTPWPCTRPRCKRTSTRSG